jgi:hypothetical protein
VRSTGHPLAVLLTVLLAVACHGPRPTVPDATPFRFDEDTLAFANETVWEYHVDPEQGTTWWYERDPRPAFSLRCGSIARSARQFKERAVFAPDRPPVDDATYVRLVREVLATDPRDPIGPRIAIPGYPHQRAFSRAHAALLQRTLDGPRASFLQRGNWRMIFPFLPGEQRREAEHIAARIRAGQTVVVHVLRYPELTMNHLVLAYAVDETPAELRFRTYDPNDAEAPVLLTWQRGARTFAWEQTPYFPGGPVRAYEVYDGLVR